MTFTAEALPGSPPATGSEESAAAAQTETGSTGQSNSETVVNPSGGQRQSEHVPYDRFQQVNEPYSALKQRAQAAGFDSPVDYLDWLETAQQPAYESPAGYGEGSDPLARQVGALTELVARQEFDRAYSSLATQFPHADKDDARRMLQLGEARTLDQAMRTLHEREERKRQEIIADYQRTAQRRQDAGAEGAGGGATTGGLDWSKMPRDEFLKRQKEILGHE